MCQKLEHEDRLCSCRLVLRQTEWKVQAHHCYWHRAGLAVGLTSRCRFLTKNNVVVNWVMIRLDSTLLHSERQTPGLSCKLHSSGHFAELQRRDHCKNYGCDASSAVRFARKFPAQIFMLVLFLFSLFIREIMRYNCRICWHFMCWTVWHTRHAFIFTFRLISLADFEFFSPRMSK